MALEIYISDFYDKKELEVNNIDGVIFVDIPKAKTAEDILKVTKLIISQCTVNNSQKETVDKDA